MTDEPQGPGFYLIDDSGTVVAYAAESVDGPTFHLHADQPEGHGPVVHGWRWLDNPPC